MATAAIALTPSTPKPSFLKHFGIVLGKILGIIAKDAKPIADTAAGVATVLFPQFAPEIAAADGLVSNIAKQAIVTETLVAAGATPVSGSDKLGAVLANVGPEIDAWVAAKFPGATAVSSASKAGLVNAVVAILNELKPAVSAPAQ